MIVSKNEMNEWALFRAVRNHESLPVLQNLLQSGFDPNELDSIGTSPLQLGLQSSVQPSVIRLLINSGGNVLHTSPAGWTLLHCAVLHHAEIETMLDLIAYGANLHARTNVVSWI